MEILVEKYVNGVKCRWRFLDSENDIGDDFMLETHEDEGYYRCYGAVEVSHENAEKRIGSVCLPHSLSNISVDQYTNIPIEEAISFLENQVQPKIRQSQKDGKEPELTKTQKVFMEALKSVG